MSVSELSSLIQTKFSNGSCKGPVFAPSDLSETTFLSFCVARLTACDGFLVTFLFNA